MADLREDQNCKKSTKKDEILVNSKNEKQIMDAINKKKKCLFFSYFVSTLPKMPCVFTLFRTVGGSLHLVGFRATNKYKEKRVQQS